MGRYALLVAAACSLVWPWCAAAQSSSSSTGLVVPARSVTLAAKIMGRINKLNADEGDRVKKGDELLRLDDAELRAELASARGSLDQAQTELAHREKLAQRMRSLVKSKSIPQESADEAEFAAASAADRVKIAQANVALVRARLAETRLLAPFDAIVTERDAEIGQLTQPGAMVFTLEDHSRLEFSTRVKEQDVAHISKGDTVTVTIDALDDAALDARVITIIPSGDPKTHAFEVKLSLPEYDKLYPGMFGKARFDH